MSSEKSVVIIPQAPKNICPICGKAAYSRGGIHPQCAMQQADEPRIVGLRAAKSVEARLKKPVEKATKNWKKRCPKCEAQVHVGRDACECGHSFGRS